MSAPQTITPDHVRALLDARSGDAVLGLVDGTVRVLDAGTGDDQGLLELATRDDVFERIGTSPDDDAVRDEADALTVAAQGIGG